MMGYTWFALQPEYRMGTPETNCIIRLLYHLKTSHCWLQGVRSICTNSGYITSFSTFHFYTREALCSKMVTGDTFLSSGMLLPQSWLMRWTRTMVVNYEDPDENCPIHHMYPLRRSISYCSYSKVLRVHLLSICLIQKAQRMTEATYIEGMTSYSQPVFSWSMPHFMYTFVGWMNEMTRANWLRWRSSALSESVYKASPYLFECVWCQWWKRSPDLRQKSYAISCDKNKGNGISKRKRRVFPATTIPEHRQIFKCFSQYAASEIYYWPVAESYTK